MAEVLVSFSSEDRDRVEPILELLRQRGLLVRGNQESWDEGPGGPMYQHHPPIPNPDVVLIFHSGHSAESEWIRQEVRFAVEEAHHLPIVLVRLDQKNRPLLSELSAIHHLYLIDSRGPSEDAERIINAIYRVPEDKKKPRVWVDYATDLEPPVPTAPAVAAASPRPAPESPEVPSRTGFRTGIEGIEFGSHLPLKQPPLMSVSYPDTLTSAQWRQLHAYLYAPADADAVATDIEARKKAVEHLHRVSSGRASTIAYGAQVTVIPEIGGVVFQPRRVQFKWRELWHRAQFDASYTGREARLEKGTVSWFVGPVCIGQVFLSAHLAPSANVTESTSQARAAGYESVFVSYSQDDREIVDWLETAYRALGMEYLRDVRSLRSGEH